MLSASDFFTIPDENLYQETSIDPLGFRVIWSYFGQKIFNYKLTTISTDIRNYTINLFHHHIIHDLFLNHSEAIAKARATCREYRTEYDLKAGLIILLEDMLTHSLVYQQKTNQSDIDLMGLLGSHKAEQAYTKDKDGILQQAEKRKGVLVRQIVLGVNGRYKGPFINMGLFNGRTFQYNEVEWLKIADIINSWETARILAKRLKEIIIDIIEANSEDYLQSKFIHYREDAELQSLIIEAFGKQQIMPEVKVYWEDKLGLKKGAALAIYNQFDNHSADKQSPRIIFEKALLEVEEESEQKKILNILKLEPFLSASSQIFYSITDKRAKEIDEIVADIEKLQGFLNIEDVLPLANENKRLSDLVDAIRSSQMDARSLIQAIITYHEKIMKQRGGNINWVELKEAKRIKHYIHQSPSWSTDKFIAKKPWYNSYYLDTVEAIQNGLS